MMVPPVHCQRRSLPRRQAVSLLELLAVMTLMGIFASVATMRLSRDVFGDTGARSEARRLSTGMLQAQRAAVRTGKPHVVVFHGSRHDVESWSIYQEENNGRRTLVDGPYEIRPEVEVSVDRQEIVFDFEGNGVPGAQVNLAGPHRRWRIQVMPLTRMIDSREMP